MKVGWFRFTWALALIGTSVYAQNAREIPGLKLETGGYHRTSFFVGDPNKDASAAFQAAYSQLGLQFHIRGDQHFAGKIDFRLNAGIDPQHTAQPLELRETYVDLYGGPFTLRLGKLITPWGKGSVFNPTDLVTPLDPTVRSPDEADLNLGSWGVKASANLGTSVTLSILWKPVFRSGKLLWYSQVFPAYVDFGEPDFPGPGLKDGTAGAMLDLRFPVLDAALYFFQGYDPLPGITLLSVVMDPVSTLPEQFVLSEFAYRTRMLGFDLAVPFGATIARTEASWKDPFESTEYDSMVPGPELACIVELESTFNWFSLVAGYYGKHILRYRESAAVPSLDFSIAEPALPQASQFDDQALGEAMTGRIAAFNRLYRYQLNENYHTLYTVLKGDILHGRLDLEVPLIYSLTCNEWNVRPKVSYSLSDRSSFSLGFMGMYGSDGSLFDMAGPALNALFISYKITFQI